MRHILITFTLLFSMLEARDYLVSWSDEAPKQNIIEFVTKTTDPRSSYFVPEADRIALFDLDGTLWSEKPLSAELYFLLSKIERFVSSDPQYKEKEPFRSAAEGNVTALERLTTTDIATLSSAIGAGMESERYRREIQDWLRNARHPLANRPFEELVYQPMTELISYLEANRFKIYIVSCSDSDFLRAIIPGILGIPGERIIGSQASLRYDNEKIIRGELSKSADCGMQKAARVYEYIGKIPIAVFGNSDSDLPLMKLSDHAHTKSLQLVVHHTDDKREFLYDSNTTDKLDEGLNHALGRHWNIVDMQKDWRVVHPYELYEKAESSEQPVEKPADESPDKPHEEQINQNGPNLF